MPGKKIQRKELAGQKFGNWTVLKAAPDRRDDSGRLVKEWYCRCDLCKDTKKVNEYSLTGGLSQKCRKCARKNGGFSGW